MKNIIDAEPYISSLKKSLNAYEKLSKDSPSLIKVPILKEIAMQYFDLANH